MNDYIPSYQEQYLKWQQARCGRFTASEIHKLFAGGKRPMTEDELKEEKANGGKRKTIDTYFGEGALTYIKTKLAEILTGEVVEVEVVATEWGNSQELDAILEFENKTGLKVDYLGKGNPQFIPYGDYAGGSPDGFVGDTALIEVKAPYNSKYHIDYLLINSVEEFKAQRFDYFAQIQMNLLVSHRMKCYFVSYNPRLIEKRLQLKILEVPRDEEFIAELKERIKEAIKELNVIRACVDDEFLITA
jgi:hypothetical protein